MNSVRLKQASYLLCLLLRLSEGRHAPLFNKSVISREVQDRPIVLSRKLHQADAPALAPGALPVDTSIIYSPDLDEPAQRQALLDLYAYTSGPSWTVQNVLANSLQEASLAAAPNAAAALEIERATFLAEQLSKFKWGTPGVSYCLWQVFTLSYRVWRKSGRNYHHMLH